MASEAVDPFSAPADPPEEIDLTAEKQDDKASACPSAGSRRSRQSGRSVRSGVSTVAARLDGNPPSRCGYMRIETRLDSFFIRATLSAGASRKELLRAQKENAKDRLRIQLELALADDDSDADPPPPIRNYVMPVDIIQWQAGVPTPLMYTTGPECDRLTEFMNRLMNPNVTD